MCKLDCKGDCGICVDTVKTERTRYQIRWNRQLPFFEIVGHSIFLNGEMVALSHKGTFVKLLNQPKL